MEELIFEWRDKTIVTTNSTNNEMELMDYTESNSSTRYFFGTKTKSKSDNNIIIQQEI